jgi:GH35 family endo-1,4-beta-xylanase
MLSLVFLCLTGDAMAEEQSLSSAVLKHRMGTLVVKAAPGAKVTIEQLEHEFWFGTAISRRIFSGNVQPEDKRKYISTLKANFNSAVHENALKWYSTERTEGTVTYDSADIMLEWCEDNGLRMRGHCVFWCVDKYVQPWIKQLDDDSLRVALKRRAVDVTRRYKGRILEYDVNNEMLHGGYYEQRLGDSIRHDMFEWCRTTDPGAILYLNDYSILSGGDLDNYEKQIAGLIEAGAPIGGIGLQGHFGPEGVDAAKVKRVLDRLAKFNLPIKITEFDINNKDEDIKAKGLADLYTTAFAHPSVDGILMWGFWEDQHWRPEAALWRKDWSPTKAAEAYRDLVYNQWWTSRKGVTDKAGTFKADVFFGRYRVTVDGQPPRVVWTGKKDAVKTVDVTAQQSAVADRSAR